MTLAASIEHSVLFNAELFPHRSLPRLGFWLVMATLAAGSFAVGLGFFLAGAWPVVGFLGLDVLLPSAFSTSTVQVFPATAEPARMASIWAGMVWAWLAGSKPKSVRARNARLQCILDPRG